jgi:hypothetical protein
MASQKTKKTGDPEVDYVVIADLFDGTMKRKQLVAMDGAAALAFAVDTGSLPSEEFATYRVMLLSQWRRIQRAERQGRKDGTVVKLPRGRGNKRKGSACALKTVPKAVRAAYNQALNMGDS